MVYNPLLFDKGVGQWLLRWFTQQTPLSFAHSPVSIWAAWFISLLVTRSTGSPDFRRDRQVNPTIQGLTDERIPWSVGLLTSDELISLSVGQPVHSLINHSTGLTTTWLFYQPASQSLH